jgi:hypothetical protein
MLRERSSRDVSIGYFAIIAVGSLLWASYGISLGNLALVIPNAVGFIVTLVTILVALRLRRHEGLNGSEHIVAVRAGGRANDDKSDDLSDDRSACEGDGLAPGRTTLPDPEIVWQSVR